MLILVLPLLLSSLHGPCRKTSAFARDIQFAVTAAMASLQEVKRLTSQNMSMRSSSAFAMEAIIADAVMTEVKEFIRGGERAAVDCGLYIGSESIGFMEATERLFKVTSKYQDENVLLLLDIKTLTPSKLSGSRSSRVSPHGYACTWKFKTTKNQSDVQAFIIGSVIEPNWVALLPKEYLESGFWRRGNQKGATQNRTRPYWYYHTQPPPFPPDLGPFLMPIKRLADALKSMRDFFTGQSEKW